MNQNLPIYEKKDEIVEAILEHQVTLLTADTGSGKSTQVPQYLHELGLSCLISQPRRPAAITVAHRVAEEMGVTLGQEVGYIVRQDRRCTPKTPVLFCTDGIGVIRTLLNKYSADVLILDEVHEFNLNIEILLAWIKRELKNPQFKVVLMSATVEVDSFKRFFPTLHHCNIPGRQYEVTDVTEEYQGFSNCIRRLVAERKNTLFFLPGKREIQKNLSLAKEVLDTAGLSAKLLPLHGEMPYSEQKEAFQSYAIPKLVFCTNVAQTAITVPDIDAVIGDGQVKQLNATNGVERLELNYLSQADWEQQSGRAGRTKPGICIRLDGWRPNTDFPVPEIRRILLDHVYIKCLMAGMDPEEVEFFHSPKKENLLEARRLLQQLGCIDNDRKLTKLGRTLGQYPVSVRYAKMLYLASQLGVFSPVASIVAYLLSDFRIKDPEWLNLQDRSDLWLAANIQEMVAGLDQYTRKDRAISGKKLRQFNEIVSELTTNRYVMHDDSAVSSGRYYFKEDWDAIKDRVTLAIISCMGDCLWSYQGSYVQPLANSYQHRSINKDSITSFDTFETPIVAGFPLDITYKDRWGYEQDKALLNFIIPFETKWVEWLPDWFETTSTCRWDDYLSQYRVKQCFKVFDQQTMAWYNAKAVETNPIPTLQQYYKTSYFQITNDELECYRGKILKEIDTMVNTYHLNPDTVKSRILTACQIKADRYTLETYFDPWTGKALIPVRAFEFDDTDSNVSNKGTAWSLNYCTNDNLTIRPTKVKAKPETDQGVKSWTRPGTKMLCCPNGHQVSMKKPMGNMYMCKQCGEYISVHTANAIPVN